MGIYIPSSGPIGPWQARVALELMKLANAVEALGGASGGVPDGDKGDIVVSASGAAWNLDSNVVSAFARTILDDTDAEAVRRTIGAGTGDLLAANNLSELVNPATARDHLGLAIGTDVQAYDATLSQLALLDPAANAGKVIKGMADGSFELAEDLTAGLRSDFVTYTSATGVIDVPLQADGGKLYDIIVEGPPTADAQFFLRVSVDNGATFLAGASDYKTTDSGAVSRVYLTPVVGSGRPILGRFLLSGLNTSPTTRFNLSGTFTSASPTGSLTSGAIGGYFNAAAPGTFNAFRIFCSAGTLANLSVRVRRMG